jgi:predicted PurR-regulated permease PerM
MAATVQRRRLSLGVLVTMTALGIVLCVLMLRPFVPGLTWALALAVTALPMHRRVQRAIKSPNFAAGISVCLVALMLLTPAVFLGWQIGRQVSEGLSRAQDYVESGQWRQTLRRYPVLRSVIQVTNAGKTPEQATRAIVPEVQRQAGQQLKFVPGLVIQVALALFTLFFLLRDRLAILNATRSLLPMTEDEATYFFHRIAGMTHATIFGTVVVALIQGGLGGLIFYLVGIPNALLWAVAMACLALIPTAGAFVIWIPAAVILAAQGHWAKAAIVGGWGAVVVASVDNILFPTLVGKEMRLHTLPVFLAILGGLSLFGAAGLVLGPIILAATVTLLEIIKRRTA